MSFSTYLDLKLKSGCSLHGSLPHPAWAMIPSTKLPPCICLSQLWRWSPHEWDECIYKNHEWGCFPFLLSHVRLQKEVSNLYPGRGSSIESDQVGNLILDFKPPKLWERNVCSLKAIQCMVLCYVSSNWLTCFSYFSWIWFKHNLVLRAPMEVFFLFNSDTLIWVTAASISSGMITYFALAHHIVWGLGFL